MTDRLAVLLYGRLVGSLERVDEGTLPSFTYDAQYVSTGRVSLSLRLPISASPYQGRRVEPYLRGLLPENRETRERWADQLDVAPDDVFAMLAEMGWDCPGAVQFCRFEEIEALRTREGEHVLVDDAAIATRLRKLFDNPASWTMPGEHWSLGGQQEKFALALLDGQWHEAHGSAATTHIVKPGIKVLLHQALVEHVTLEAAAALGVDVAGSSIVQFEDQWALVVKRFDRVVGDGGAIVRIHQEDFCQALGRLPEVKYESRGGPTLLEMARLVRKWSSQQGDDLMALADFTAINLVAGAPDGHSKNISLLLAPGGQRWVAPLYDLATGLSYASGSVERKVAVSIGGERIFSRIRRKQWERTSTSIGLPLELVLDRAVMLAEHYPDAFATALARCRDVPGADLVADRTLTELTKHCARLVRQWGPA